MHARVVTVVAIATAVAVTMGGTVVVAPNIVGAVVAAGISVAGAALCLRSWGSESLLDIRNFADLTGASLASFVVIGLFFVGDCVIAGVNPLKTGNWAALFDSGGPLGFTLTAGVAAVAVFFVVATAARIGLARYLRQSDRATGS